ncbi:MAG: hypothetical protein ACXAEX_04765 [Promethearchaeota archaeon]|jgi:hypothetical protein
MNPILGAFMIFGTILALFFGFPLISVYLLNLIVGSPKLTSAVKETAMVEEYQIEPIQAPIPVIMNKAEAQL